MDSDSDDGSVSSNNTELEKNFNTYIPDMTSEDALVARSVLAFLLEPSSSVYSFAYNTTASFLVILHILQVCLETCDGPNHYYHREDLSAYSFLLSENSYRIVEMVFVFPLLIDAVFRVAFLGWMQVDDNLKNLSLHEVWMDPLRCSIIVTEIIGVLPFLASVIANEQPTNEFARLAFRIVDLFLIGKVFRSIKDMPAVWAIRLTLYNAVPQLILPIFFFVVFNVTAAVVLYYMEPCYDQTACAWISLFDSTFYSVVTMTTTGYGDQIPVLEYTRMMACFVMIFGVLFMSMPLAIMGNEYEDAWKVVNQKIEEKEFIERMRDEQTELEILRKKMPASSTETLSLSLSPDIGGSKSSEVRDPSPYPKSGYNSVAPAPFAPGAPAERPTPKPQFSKLDEGDEDEMSSEDEDGNEPVRVGGGGLVAARVGSGDETDPLVRSLMEPLSKIKALIVKTDELLTMSQKISPAVLLSACELSGWLTPLCYSIKNASHDIQQKCLMFQSECDSQTELLMSEYGSIRMIRDTKIPAAKPTPPAQAPAGAGSHQRTHNPGKKRLSVMGGNLKEFTTKQNKIHEGHESILHSMEEEKAKILGERSSPAFLQEAGGRARTISEAELEETKKSETNLISRESFIGNKVNILRDSTSFALRRQSVIIFDKTLRWAQHNPQSWRAQLWLALEQPHVSTEARILQVVLIIMIGLSILVIFTETLPSWSNYGESSRLCGKVLEQYCADKNDNYIDPACFVQSVDTWTGVTFPSSSKLTYGQGHDSSCSGPTCFGYGANYGGPNTNMSCAYMDGTTPKLGDSYTSYYLAPFQDSLSLINTYGYATIFTGRKATHQLSPICNRIECNYEHEMLVHGNPIWILCESVFNAVFVVEILIRMSVSYSVAEFFLDKMNIMDMMAVAPFILDIMITAASDGGIESLDLGIIASTPEPIILTALRSFKVFRLFSLTRHFKSSKVLYETARRVWKQILGIISLLFFCSILFGLIMYELERGSACYVGDSGCVVPDDAIVKTGERILLNKYGDLTTIPNVFYGIWFTIVTMLTVGYGEIVPVSNGGMSMAVCLMLFGSMYMAMPLTAAATNFFLVHDLYKEKNRKRQIAREKAEQEKMEKLRLKMEKKLRRANDDESDDDEGKDDEEEEGTDTNRSILAGNFDLADKQGGALIVPFKPGNKGSGVDLSTQLYAENVKAAHEQKVKRMKREVHKFLVNKLMHIQFILDKLLTLTDSVEVKTIPTKDGTADRGLSTRFDKLPMFIAKATLLKSLKVDMLNNMRTVAMAIVTNSNSKPDSHEVDNHDEVAMTYCLDSLKRTYQAGVANIHVYLETIMLEIILKNCEARKVGILRFVEGLQAPQSKNDDSSRKHQSDTEHSEEEDPEEEDDEVFDPELKATQFRRDSLLGKYQLLLNKLNNVMKVADEDIQCLCKILVYVNKNIDDDIHSADYL